MREIIHLSSDTRETLIDITEQVRAVVTRSGARDGVVSVHAVALGSCLPRHSHIPVRRRGATAAILVQENWDDSVQTDVVELLRRLIPRGVWRHDAQDGNGDAHLKAGLVGPSQTIPLIDGHLGLSRWQNVFFCEFADGIEARAARQGWRGCGLDGPRPDRRVVCTVLADKPGLQQR